MKKIRSSCPQSLILDIIGDKWTLLIIRDMMIEEKKYFREFLHSKEKIASNILASRLQSLLEEGIIYQTQDAEHKQKIIYRLTEKGIDLFPILIENARWSIKYQPVGEKDAKKTKAILASGSKGMEKIMEQLKKEHLSH